MIFIRSKQFEQQMRRLPLSIRRKALERMQLYLSDPHQPLLNLHSLTGEYSGFYSINVTGDYRILFEHIDNDTVYVRLIGTHSELYK